MAESISRSSIHNRKAAEFEAALPPGILQKVVHGATFQTYPIGLGTAAVYISLSNLKWHPDFITSIEVFLFGVNVFLFTLTTVLLLAQVFVYPKQFLRYVKDPKKGFFVPLFVLDFATIIVGTVLYGTGMGRTHVELVYMFFWVYLFLALVVCGAMNFIWFFKPHPLDEYTLAFAFLVFPLMLVGVVAINTLRVVPLTDRRSLQILIIGYTFQGLGTCMTFAHIVIYLFKMITLGFPRGHIANGSFVAPGPPGFTALVLINLGRSSQTILPKHTPITQAQADVFFAVAILAATFLLGFAMFLWVFAAAPYWFIVHKSLRDALAYWALTFPQVGWIVTLRVLGDIYDLMAFWVLQAIMTGVLVMIYVTLVVVVTFAVARGELLVSRDEDVLSDTLPGYGEWLLMKRRLEGEGVEGAVVGVAQAGGGGGGGGLEEGEVDLEKGDRVHGECEHR